MTSPVPCGWRRVDGLVWRDEDLAAISPDLPGDQRPTDAQSSRVAGEPTCEDPALTAAAAVLWHFVRGNVLTSFEHQPASTRQRYLHGARTIVAAHECHHPESILDTFRRCRRELGGAG